MRARRFVFGFTMLMGMTAGTVRAEPRPPPEIVAIVAGSNHSPAPTIEELRYADDDAIQNARTLALLGSKTVLLVTPDAESTELGDVRRDGAATSAALVGAFERAFAALATAKRANRPTRFYFFFAGHGDVEGERPFLQLDDGRLWRDDLIAFLRRSPADENHVVIDACQSSLFVGSRGPGGERIPLARGFSPGRGSALAGTHWISDRPFERRQDARMGRVCQAGIFSHEVRSGLLGAADLNLDGRVTYRELAASSSGVPTRRSPIASIAPP